MKVPSKHASTRSADWVSSCVKNNCIMVFFSMAKLPKYDTSFPLLTIIHNYHNYKNVVP